MTWLVSLPTRLNALKDDSLIDQRRIFLNIHGHTHESSGECTVGNAKVINPGALKEGKFVILDMVRKTTAKGSGKWLVEKTQYYDLF